MAQKLFSFAVVLAVGLFGSAALVNGLQVEAVKKHDNQTFPGVFARTGDFLRPITVNTTRGVLEGFHSVRNTSEWKQLRGDNYTAMTQNVTFPKMLIRYNNASFKVGRLASVGRLTVNLTETPVNVTVKATKVESACDLKITAVPLKAPVNLTLEDGSLSKKILQSSVSAFNATRRQLTRVVGILTPNILSYSLGEKIASLVNLDELCDSLLGTRKTLGDGFKFTPRLNLNLNLTNV